MKDKIRNSGLLALSPLAVFLGIYLVSSLIAKDFYKIPIAAAFLIASAYALLISKKAPIEDKIAVFSRGAGHKNVLLMLWIFILAGAFAETARQIGAIDATVSATLNILPPSMLFVGLFLASCFISMAIGTSVGTIVALVPVAAGIASESGFDTGFVTAIVAGGAFFGDNLSFISDTTIAATSTQGCKMNDKFRVNFFITLPAAIITLALYVFLGQEMQPLVNVHGINYLKILPYIAVLSTAIAGMNVMLVLTIGLAITGVIGLLDGSFDVFEWFHSMGDGILSMGELIIITMLAGGVFEIVQKKGGIDFIIAKTTAGIKGKRGAEAVIGLMVAIVDLCTANNTVAIISTGNIARRISERFELDKRKVASLLDTCSCCAQGFIPYGAQMLMAAGLTQLNPVRIMPYLFYPMALTLCVVVAIIFRLPRRYS